MRIAAAAGVALGTIVLLTGCGQRSEPTGPKVQIYPVTVDQPSGPSVVLDHRPTDVVALTPEAASLLSSVLGRKISPDHGGRGAELVVTTPESLNRRPPRAYVAPDSSIDAVEDALTDLGLLLDRPIAARQLVEGIETKRRFVHEHLKGVPPVTVFVDTGLFTTVSNHSLLGNLIQEAGGRSVAGAGPQAGPFEVGRLMRANPDFYLATSDSGTTLADLRRDPRTRHLKAVREHHFATLASRVVQPGGEIGTELLAIARYLHPDAFR
jgi:ABC-type Fe3+-hydroxamate transport system substrate-binding protein